MGTTIMSTRAFAFCPKCKRTMLAFLKGSEVGTVAFCARCGEPVGSPDGTADAARAAVKKAREPG